METASPFLEDFTMHVGLCHPRNRVPDLLGKPSVMFVSFKEETSPPVSSLNGWKVMSTWAAPITSVQRFSSFSSCSHHQISSWKHRFLGGQLNRLIFQLSKDLQKRTMNQRFKNLEMQGTQIKSL